MEISASWPTSVAPWGGDVPDSTMCGGVVSSLRMSSKKTNCPLLGAVDNEIVSSSSPATVSKVTEMGLLHGTGTVYFTGSVRSTGKVVSTSVGTCASL